MNTKNARIIGILLLVLSVAVNFYGFITLPSTVSIEMFGETPLPTIMLLVLAFALTALGIYRLMTEDKPPVITQWVVILSVMVIANGVLVFIG